MIVRDKMPNLGSGITEKRIEHISVEDPFGRNDRGAIGRLLSQAETIKIKGDDGRSVTLTLRHPFEPEAALIEQHARSTLANAGGSSFGRDSRADYAARALVFLDRIRRCIANKDASATAHHAMKLGALLIEEHMKFAHEPAALTGQKQRASLAATREQKNAERHDARAREWAKWQAEADTIWARHPNLTKTAVAAAVRKNLKIDDAAGTIAARIKIAREAG